MKIEKAKIKTIGTTKTVGSNGFETRDLIVVTDEQYPQIILIQFMQGKTIDLDGFAINDIVDIEINLRGREWTNPQGETIVFNTIQGWKITKK